MSENGKPSGTSPEELNAMIEPPLADAPGFIRNLRGGWERGGRTFRASAMTGKPLVGAYAGGFTAAIGLKNGKTAMIAAPPAFAVEAGHIKPAIEMIGKQLASATGDQWNGEAFPVNFMWYCAPA